MELYQKSSTLSKTPFIFFFCSLVCPNKSRATRRWERERESQVFIRMAIGDFFPPLWNGSSPPGLLTTDSLFFFLFLLLDLTRYCYRYACAFFFLISHSFSSSSSFFLTYMREQVCSCPIFSGGLRGKNREMLNNSAQGFFRLLYLFDYFIYSGSDGGIIGLGYNWIRSPLFTKQVFLTPVQDRNFYFGFLTTRTKCPEIITFSRTKVKFFTKK